MPSASGFRVRRVYDPPEAADGVRILVDRLWPRGVAKERAAVDEWCKDVTPSAGLRTWYHDHPELYDDFAARYLAELSGPGPGPALGRLRELARDSRVTLLTAVKEPERSHVPVLLGYLQD